MTTILRIFALVCCLYGSWLFWMLGAGKLSFSASPGLSKLPFITNKYVCYGLAVFYILFAVNSVYINWLK